MKKNKLLLVSSLVFIISFMGLFIFYQSMFYDFDYILGWFLRAFNVDLGFFGKIAIFIVSWSFIYFPLAGIIGIVFNGKKKRTLLPIVFGIINILYAASTIIIYHLTFRAAIDNGDPSNVIAIVSLIVSVLYLIGAVQNKRDTLK